jgi:uncharacterized membrane protein YvlD (DUF360 family)
MERIKNILGMCMNACTNRNAGLQGTLFLVFAIISLFTQNHDRFWMFIIGSVVFSALQSIIDELRKLNKNNN